MNFLRKYPVYLLLTPIATILLLPLLLPIFAIPATLLFGMFNGDCSGDLCGVFESMILALILSYLLVYYLGIHFYKTFAKPDATSYKRVKVWLGIYMALIALIVFVVTQMGY